MSYRKDPKDLHAVPTRPLLPLTNHTPLYKERIVDPRELPTSCRYDFGRPLFAIVRPELLKRRQR